MPRYIFKADRDADLYMEWSTIVDAPTWVGTREELLNYLPDRDTPERVARADATGTSSAHGDGGWDEKEMIYEQLGCLPRRNFGELARRLISGSGRAEVSDLLDPFDDEPTEVRA